MTDSIEILNNKFLDACFDGNIELVKLLIEKGANNFREAIFHASEGGHGAEGGHDDIVQIMLCKLSSLDPDNYELKMLAESPFNDEDLNKYLLGSPPSHHEIRCDNGTVKIYDENTKMWGSIENSSLQIRY